MKVCHVFKILGILALGWVALPVRGAHANPCLSDEVTAAIEWAEVNRMYFSPQMHGILERAVILSRSNVDVVLTGETGAGKEIFARLIHAKSARGHKPFVVLDCTQLPPETALTEIFGTVPGVFTGATNSRGAIERANGGTLFIDEIAKLSPQAQRYLLKFLDVRDPSKRHISRMGREQEEVPVDVRIVAASNRDLRAMVERGEFNRALYDRLFRGDVEIPPLRQRSAEIIPLARELLIDLGRVHRVSGELSPASESVLRDYSWPGNVRELRNVLERALLLSNPQKPIEIELSPEGKPQLVSDPVYERAIASRVRERSPGAGSYRDSVMDAPLAQAHLLGLSNSDTLLVGPSGAGASQMARMIHDQSSRRSKKLIEVDAASLDGQTMLNRLFGYKKGAFTGAERDEPGLISYASGSHLFIDHIDQLSMDSQAALLRFLNETNPAKREIKGLGDSFPQRVDVRVIAATNADLAGMVRQGLFLEDLYFRLNRGMIKLPALRERPQDILAIAQSTMRLVSSQNGKAFTELTEESKRGLLAYDWPGNVRELENFVERAVILGPRGTAQLQIPALPASKPGGAGGPKGTSLADGSKFFLELYPREALDATLDLFFIAASVMDGKVSAGVATHLNLHERFYYRRVANTALRQRMTDEIRKSEQGMPLLPDVQAAVNFLRAQPGGRISWQAFKDQMVVDAISAKGGNKSQAGPWLGLNRQSLLPILKRLGQRVQE